MQLISSLAGALLYCILFTKPSFSVGSGIEKRPE
jgi:hypothetical protein